MTIWDQSNDRGLASDAQLIQCTIFCFSSVSWQKSLTTTSDSDTEPHLENNVAVAMEGVEMDDDEGDPFRDDGKFPSGTTPPLSWPQSASDVSHRTNQAEWRPIGPFVNTSRPDHAALHGTLTVASIYEEINDLHEETVDIVLAQNREVRRQLAALKKDISDLRSSNLPLRTTSSKTSSPHQSAYDFSILVLSHIVVAFIVWIILHWVTVQSTRNALRNAYELAMPFSWWDKETYGERLNDHNRSRI